MRALRLYGARDARLEEIPVPELRLGTVNVKVAWGGICGSDLALYQHMPVPLEHRNPIIGEIGPHVLGHEFSGYVQAVADDVSHLSVGELVSVKPNRADGTCPTCLAGYPHMCDNFAFIGINGGGGGFSETVVVPAENAFALPPGFNPELAALIEPLTVAWHAVKLGQLTPVDSALVIGGGPIGLAILLSLKAVGVNQIIVSEPSELRRALAAKLGATTVINPYDQNVVQTAREHTDGVGVRASFDASGAGDASLQPAIDALTPAGRAVIVATFEGDVRLNVLPILVREKTVVGSFAYTAADYGEVRDAVVGGRIDPTALVTSRIPLTDIVHRGLEHLLGTGRSTEVKILVNPALPPPSGGEDQVAATSIGTDSRTAELSRRPR